MKTSFHVQFIEEEIEVNTIARKSTYYDKSGPVWHIPRIKNGQGEGNNVNNGQGVDIYILDTGK